MVTQFFVIVLFNVSQMRNLTVLDRMAYFNNSPELETVYIYGGNQKPLWWDLNQLNDIWKLELSSSQTTEYSTTNSASFTTIPESFSNEESLRNEMSGNSSENNATTISLAVLCGILSILVVLAGLIGFYYGKRKGSQYPQTSTEYNSFPLDIRKSQELVLQPIKPAEGVEIHMSELTIYEEIGRY